jgi:hypothetical protein
MNGEPFRVRWLVGALRRQSDLGSPLSTPGSRGPQGVNVLARKGDIKCSSCGIAIAIPAGAKLRTMIVGASGKPNMHVLVVDGVEVHRCEAQTQIDLSDDEAAEAQMS